MPTTDFPFMLVPTIGILIGLVLLDVLILVEYFKKKPIWYVALALMGLSTVVGAWWTTTGTLNTCMYMTLVSIILLLPIIRSIAARKIQTSLRYRLLLAFAAIPCTVIFANLWIGVVKADGFIFVLAPLGAFMIVGGFMLLKSDFQVLQKG